MRLPQRLPWFALAAGCIAATAFAAVALVAVAVVVAGANLAGACGGPQPGASGPALAASIRGAGRRQIPSWLLPIYSGAASAYRLGPAGWAWLAAINRQETDFGRNRATSPAGALGWMQFLPATWSHYAVDAHRRGRSDPHDPADAVYSAARYLRASGAPADWHRAILVYNHSEAYFGAVAAHAASYLEGPGGFRAPPRTPAEPPPGFTVRGYTSTFNDAVTASGISAAGSVPGIALRYPGSVGGYWLVTYPNHRRLILRQIDTGPASGLGPAPEHRVLDTDYAAAVAAGYTLASFPTDRGLVTAVYLGRDARWARLAGQPVASAAPTSPTGGCPAVGAVPGSGTVTASGYALPLERRFMTSLGRTDDGVDIENAPDGATVYSITPGVCTAVASNPGGFGPNYPVIRADTGPLAGQHIYYGHVARALTRPGQHVAAGAPIALTGHTGDAAGLGHGHIEIGFSDAGGNPLDHHGAVAATPAGARMRAFLVALGAGAGIRLR